MRRRIMVLMVAAAFMLADAAPALAHVVLITPGRDMNVARLGLNRAAGMPAGAHITTEGDGDGDGGSDYRAGRGNPP